MAQNETILVATQHNIATTTGGAITIFRVFCNMLSRHGYQVIATCHSPNPSRPVWLDPDIRFVNTQLCYPGEDRYRVTLNRLIEESQPSLIVFFFAEYYLEAHLLRKYKHIPRILMFHSRPDFYFAWMPSLKRRLRKYYLNTTAQVLMESFIDLLPWYMKRGPVAVIPNGVYTFDECADYSAEHKKMVFFSRVDRCKGIEILIDAMAIVHQKYPDWSIDLYGDTEPEAYRLLLEKRIAQKQLEGYVRFMGVSKKSVGETLSQYDLCLFPSRFEGFGLGLAECMAAGLPCVGFNNSSAVNEMLIHGVSGLLCDDTPEALAQSAIYLIEHPEERKRMGLNAREWVKQYNPTVVEMKWLMLIDHILHKGEKNPLLPVEELIRLTNTPLPE